MKSGSSSEYIPHRGDFVWIDLDPTVGHEQAGRRPALVISDRIYNSRSRLVAACPITTRQKGYTAEVSLPDGCAVRGVILTDQLRFLDWRQRNVELIGHAPTAVLGAVLELLAVLLGIPQR